MYNNYFLCSSIGMLMSSDKEEDPDVIPEDSSLLTLQYVIMVHSQHPEPERGGRCEASTKPWLASCSLSRQWCTF